MLKEFWNKLFPCVPSFICHWCSQEYKITKAVKVFTSSDERHQGNFVCRKCFDEKIIKERFHGI